jgi:hypothetical protein
LHIIEDKFNLVITKKRNGKFKHINDIFYEKYSYGINLSRIGNIMELFSS